VHPIIVGTNVLEGSAVALRLPLVTWDVGQRDRAARLVAVPVPENSECARSVC